MADTTTTTTTVADTTTTTTTIQVGDEDYLESLVNSQLNVTSMDEVVVPSTPADGPGLTDGSTSTNIQEQTAYGNNVIDSGIVEPAPDPVYTTSVPDATGFMPYPYTLGDSGEFIPLVVTTTTLPS